MTRDGDELQSLTARQWLQKTSWGGVSLVAAERRLVANGKAKRVRGWTPAYPDYRAGLRAVSATTSPAPASAAPPAASGDQR